MRKYLVALWLIVQFVHCSRAQELKKEGTIILGSYHAYFMDWGKLKSFKKNSSVPDFTSQQLAWTLKYSVIDENPQYCILQTGPEDLLLGISPERIIENISKIYSELEQDSIGLVIISGIQNPNKRSVGSVNKLNSEIENWAFQNEVLYINISDIISSPVSFDEDFKILEEYQQKIIRRINIKLKELESDSGIQKFFLE